jgi:hypothetical protein
MYQQYVSFVKARASGKVVLTVLVLYFLYAAVVMGWGAKKIQTLSGKEVQVLDLCFTGYSPDEVNKYLADYTPAAKVFAATFEAVADSIYPIIYTTLLTLLLAWVFKRSMQSDNKFGYLLLLPLLIMLSDFAENYHIITMLTMHPDITEEIVKRGSFFTVAKWGMFALISLIVVIGLLRKWIRK